MEQMTYAKAGVDIDKESRAIKALAMELLPTLALRKGKIGESLLNIGHFAALISLGDKKALALSADGVGTKILVAKALEKYDTLGIDLIAMNVNDIICVGAEPLALVDYIAIDKPDEKIMSELGRGLAEGARIAGISIVGGETATIPEIVRGFDIAGLCLGIVDTDRIITGKDIEPGDVVVGLRSSGIHSNGLTLARKVIFSEYAPEDEIFPGRKAAEELLEPTRIYVKEVLSCVKKGVVKGLAHITGGGLGNLARITQYGFYLDNLPEPQPIFRLIQELGNVPEAEMYRTFNMGVGFCIVCSPENANEVIKLCSGAEPKIVGRVMEERGVRIEGRTGIIELNPG